MACPDAVLKVAVVLVSVSELVDLRAPFELWHSIHCCTLLLLHSGDLDLKVRVVGSFLRVIY